MNGETTKENKWREKHDTQKDTAMTITRCLDAVFKAQKELETKLSPSWVKVDYFISHQETGEHFFAEFEVNKGLTKIKRTFIFDLYHQMCGFELDPEGLERELKRFVVDVKSFSS